MSVSDPCPHQAELVDLLDLLDLLDRDASVEPRGHLGECVRCQAELGHLRAGFAALGEATLGEDDQALQRIAARVMPPVLADLADLAGVPAAALPVNVLPTPRPSRVRALPQLGLLGALAALGVVPIVLYWLKIGETPLKPARALGLALLPLGLLPAVLGSVRLRRSVLAGALGLTGALMLSTVASLDLAALRGAGCLLFAASGCLVPALVVLRAATREHASALSGALLGAAIGSGGAAVQRLFCGSSDLSHTLAFHLGPFLFFIALTGLLGSWVGRATAAGVGPHRAPAPLAPTVENKL